MFEENIKALRKKVIGTKEDLIKLFLEVVPEFHHKDTGKYLDQRMKCNVFLIFFFCLCNCDTFSVISFYNYYLEDYR